MIYQIESHGSCEDSGGSLLSYQRHCYTGNFIDKTKPHVYHTFNNTLKES